MRAVAERSRVRALLRHGARFIQPEPEIVEVATWLAGLGLIGVRWAKCVRCAEPDDSDYPPVVVDCHGLIELRETADDGGGDYRCPVCGRLVYPEADHKQAIETLCVELRRNALEASLIDRLGALGAGRSFSGGVLSVPLESQTAYVCLVG